MNTNNFILTNAGIAASYRTIETEEDIQLTFTHIGIGSEAYPEGDTLKLKTELKKEVQRIELNAGYYNTDTKQLELAAILPFPSTISTGFPVHEVGIYIKNTTEPDKPILALIWSNKEPLAIRSVGDELYLSVAVVLQNINTDNIAITTTTPNINLLLKQSFDQYILKDKIKTDFVFEPDDKDKDKYLASYMIVKNIKQDVDLLKAEKKIVDIGQFPKYFAPALTKGSDGSVNMKPSYETIIGPPTDSFPGRLPGHYSFKGGTFYILGKHITLPSYEDTNADTTFFGLAEPHVAVHSRDHIPRIQDDEKLLFVLEIRFEKPHDADYNITDIELKVIRENEYTEQDLNGNSITSPLQIELANFTKKDADQVISKDELEHVNLLKYAKIDLDASDAHNYKFKPVNPYIVKIINKQPNTTMHIEVIGPANIPSTWEDMEQAHIYAYHSHNEKELFNVFTDFDNELSVSSLYEKDWTQKLGVGIGRIHPELITLADYKKEFSLSLPCDGKEIDAREYPLYKIWAAPGGTLTSVATALGITYNSTTKKISLPDFKNEPHLRFVFDDVGRFQEDAMPSHTHEYKPMSWGVVQAQGSRSDRTVPGGNITSTLNTGPAGKGLENRVKNRGFLPLIKVR